ncbi:hypothetical protein [Ktedonospora formicarum]|nr:hypothetical protein [Ktedonospora formicarum]
MTLSAWAVSVRVFAAPHRMLSLHPAHSPLFPFGQVNVYRM